MTEPDPHAKEGPSRLPEASESTDAQEGAGRECSELFVCMVRLTLCCEVGYLYTHVHAGTRMPNARLGTSSDSGVSLQDF